MFSVILKQSALNILLTLQMLTYRIQKKREAVRIELEELITSNHTAT